jgi:hypothetical protein
MTAEAASAAASPDRAKHRLRHASPVHLPERMLTRCAITR